MFLECLSAGLELEGATGSGVPITEHSVTSLHLSSPSLKGQGEKSHYRVIIAETGVEGYAWGLRNWSFVSPSLFASSLPWERLSVILDLVELGLLCPPPAAAMGRAGLECLVSPSCREVAVAAAAMSWPEVTLWGMRWQKWCSHIYK